jgi:hypothetical protein
MKTIPKAESQKIPFQVFENSIPNEGNVTAKIKLTRNTK